MKQADAGGLDSGVTLLELLVVLAIMALAAVLVAPALRGPGGGIGLRGVAAEIAGLTTSERALAMRTSSERTLLVDVDRREFWVEGTPRRTIPARYTVSVSVTPGEQLGSSRARIRFFPDGGSSGGSITVADGRQRAILSVDWLTGASRMTWSR